MLRISTSKNGQKKFKNKQTKQMNKQKTSRTNNKEKTQIKESIKQNKNAFWESKRSSCLIVKAFREQAVLKKSHLNHERDLSWKNNTMFPLSEATFIFTRASLPIANPLIILYASAKSPAIFWFWIRAASRTLLKTGSTGLRAWGPSTPFWPTAMH